MAKYRVDFEFRLEDYEVSDGKWHKDYLDNNGEGFTFEDAEKTAIDLRMSEYISCRWCEVNEMN